MGIQEKAKLASLELSQKSLKTLSTGLHWILTKATGFTREERELMRKAEIMHAKSWDLTVPVAAAEQIRQKNEEFISTLSPVEETFTSQYLRFLEERLEFYVNPTPSFRGKNWRQWECSVAYWGERKIIKYPQPLQDFRKYQMFEASLQRP